MKRPRAFTLIELLVVVAIIALLIAILLPSLNRARESSRRTVCGTQLKSQGMSIAIYAAQYNDCIPSGPDFNVAGSSFMHDNSVLFSDTLAGISTSNGMNEDSVRRWFYCPSNQIYNADAYWRPTTNTNFAKDDRRLGYAYLNYRLGNISSGNTTINTLPTGVTRTPPLEWHTKWASTPYASQAELITDIIMLDTSTQNLNVGAPRQTWPVPSALPITVQFRNEPAFNVSSYPVVYNNVSHINGTAPAGANFLAFDGHAAWKQWNPNGVMWVNQVGGSGNGCWFFINPE